jgi:hypothetical protein
VPAAERVFWTGGSCTVWVAYTDDGALHFAGQDLAAFGDPGYQYEYDILVAPDQFDAMRLALGVTPDVDLLTAVCGHVDDIMPAGERTWLDAHNIAHSLNTWHRPPG